MTHPSSTQFNTAVFSISATLLFLGCSPSPVEPENSSLPAEIVQGSQPTQPQKDAMLSAKEALFTKLSGRLVEALGSTGPASAITICQKEAPKIAAEVGEEHGLKIGRTGVRLRNQDNTPPKWAEALVAAKTDTPTFVTLSNGHAAALLPIKLQGQCLMCHGPQDQIAPVIQEQLTKLYPNDAATGFSEGELRGWFWIDLPNG
jgi:hypothetical protein